MQNESMMSEINETNKIYEVSFIFDNKIDENAAIEKSAKIKELIASSNGSFISEETPYKRELAYEMIRVQNNVNVRFNEGYFGWIKFSLEGAKISTLDKNLKLDEEVVRYMIVRAEVGNDVFTKDKAVFKSHNEIFVTAPVVENSEANIDTTTMSDVVNLEEEIITEDKKVELTNEAEAMLNK